MSSNFYAHIAGEIADEDSKTEAAFLDWLDACTRRPAEGTYHDDLRAAFEAGRKSIRDEQQAIADQILGELDGEPDPEPGTVGWLRDQTLGYRRDAKVILAKDAEGNGYSPLAAIEEAMYEATSTWAGEVYQTPEVVEAEPGEWSAAPDSAERVIVLGPVN